MLKKIFQTLLFLFLFFELFKLPIYAQNNYHPDRVLVKFKSFIPPYFKQSFFQQNQAELLDTITPLNINILHIKSGKVMDLVNKFKNNFFIEFIEPDYEAHAVEITNDPALAVNQWGLYKISAAGNGISAFSYSKSGPSVKIAILDTGIDQNHEDLSSKIVLNKNCTNTSSVDDFYGHGTHVAGIAGATTNNGTGIAGVGYYASLINAKVLDNSGSGYYSWIANCITWAANSGAKIINMSLGGSSSSNTLLSAVNYAWSKGVILVAAAGNSNTSAPLYPGYYNNVISVAATDTNDQKASFSSYGNWVSVAAPGVSIYSTLPNHNNSLGPKNYGTLSGTSMSTPFVSGLAALLFSLPNTDNIKVRNYIQNYADQIPGTGSYWIYGRINALNSILAAFPSVSSSVSPTPVPTVVPTPSPTPTPITTPKPTPTPTSIPWWCIKYPTFCR